MKYYRLRDDINFPHRWYLGDVRYVDNWLYRDPPIELMEPGKSTIDLYCDGSEMDFTLTERYAVPIVSEDFCTALEGIYEVDEPYNYVVFNPINIADKDTIKKYFSMVIETQLDCVDEEKSDFDKYEVNDPIRPDLSGDYKAFFKLVINPDNCEGRHIFRLRKHLGAIIVSEEIKNRLERISATGFELEPVN